MKIGKWQKKIKQNPAIIQGSGIIFAGHLKSPQRGGMLVLAFM